MEIDRAVEEIHVVKTANAFIFRVRSLAVKSEIFSLKKNLKDYKQGTDTFTSVVDNLTEKQGDAHKACLDIKFRIQDKHCGHNNVLVKKIRGHYAVVIKSTTGADKVFFHPEGTSGL